MKYNVCTMNTHAPSRRRRARLARSLATAIWGKEISPRQLVAIRDLVEKFGFSLVSGEIQLLNGNWYVTHAGLLSLAQRRRCEGIQTVVLRQLSDSAIGRWVFKATVYKKRGCRGFVGYGDADPSNVSPLVRGAEMRVAETRAVNRALRKAYGIGLCSVEELGWLSGPRRSRPRVHTNSNGFHRFERFNNGQPRLRDQLCLLIRQYNLDPTLVKAYAADFCGTETLRTPAAIWSSPSSPTSRPQQKKTSTA